MLPSDPRWRAYDELQRTLCLALNRSCHFNLARWLRVDEVMWEAVHLPALVGDVKDEMTRIARSGRDD